MYTEHVYKLSRFNDFSVKSTGERSLLKSKQNNKCRQIKLGVCCRLPYPWESLNNIYRDIRHH